MSGYLTIARISGDPDLLLERYRRSSDVMDGVGRDHGLIVHAAAREDHGLVLVNLWPSRDASESAAQDPRRIKTIADQQITPDQIRREHLEVGRYELFR